MNTNTTTNTAQDFNWTRVGGHIALTLAIWAATVALTHLATGHGTWTSSATTLPVAITCSVLLEATRTNRARR